MALSNYLEHPYMARSVRWLASRSATLEASRAQGYTLKLTLKIVSGNKVVDLTNLVALAPLYSVHSYPNPYY